MEPTFTQRCIKYSWGINRLGEPVYTLSHLGGAEPVYEQKKLIPLITSLLSVHFYSFWLEKVLIKRKQMNVQRCVPITSIFFFLI